MNFDQTCDIICRSGSFIEQVFYNIPDDSRMPEHCTNSQTENAGIAARDRIFLSRDKSVDLTGILSCRTTLLECLRHNLLSSSF